MTGAPSRRAVLQALGSLPVLVAAGRGAAAGDSDRSPLSAAQRLTGFATAQAETLAAPLTTLSGRLPPALAGVLWRNGPAEHDRFGHRYGHWFDGDGMVQAFTFSGTGVSHRARILDTPKRRRETEAGKRLLPTFATLPPETVPIPLARRHERGEHLRAGPWGAAHGALGRRLGARVRSRDAGSRRLRLVAARSCGRALLGPSQGRGGRHLLEHRLRHGAPADAAVLPDRPRGPARRVQRAAGRPARHGARLCRDCALSGARALAVRGRAGALRRRPDQLFGRPMSGGRRSAPE